MTYQQLQSTQRRRPPAALQYEAQLPACCFSINGASVLHEGVNLELKHPALSQDSVAMFVGHRYIFRNSSRGCLYTRRGDQGHVRRAKIEWKYREDKPALPVLTQPSGSDSSCLVHIDVSIDMTRKHYVERFFEGVVTDGTLVERAGTESLISLEKGETATIFYLDGRASKATNVGGTIELTKLDLEDTAQARLDRAILEIRSAQSKIDEDQFTTPDGYVNMVKMRDRALHEICAVMRVGGGRSRTIFDLAYEVMTNFGRDGLLSAETVRAHAHQCVGYVDSSMLEDFEQALLQYRFKGIRSEPLLPAATRKGPPIERKKFLADRAAERAKNAPAKGPAGNNQKGLMTNPKTIAKRAKQEARRKK